MLSVTSPHASARTKRTIKLYKIQAMLYRTGIKQKSVKKKKSIMQFQGWICHCVSRKIVYIHYHYANKMILKIGDFQDV